jgi:hypothetical protein
MVDARTSMASVSTRALGRSIEFLQEAMISTTTAAYMYGIGAREEEEEEEGEGVT